MLFVAWEDLAGSTVWSSRRQLHPDFFGSMTIHGLAFGQDQRLERQEEWLLDHDLLDRSLQIPSYNEAMLQHRTERVARWRSSYRQPQSSNIDASVLTIMSALTRVLHAKSLSERYQWPDVRAELQSDALQHELEPAVSRLRDALLLLNDKDAVSEIGFDWGSCAMRHCGALADAEEALDELDHLLGVLEPFEATFCLDVIERSLRDVLAVVPTEVLTSRTEEQLRQMPEYHPHRIYAPDLLDDAESASAPSTLDLDYWEALAELRVD